MRYTHPNEYISPELKEVFTAISDGMFGFAEEMSELLDSVRYNNDNYLVCQDFAAYCEAQNNVKITIKMT
jgi:Glucan phosphorylase